MTQLVRLHNLELFGFGPNVMKRSKVCAHCGSMIGVKEKRCPSCGAQPPKETVFDLYRRLHARCTSCDTVLSPGSHYCPQCGRQIEKT